jgi:putative molybdopterin biosynthesis protein
VSPADGGTRPVPRVAYQRWLDALTRVGWSARPAPGGSGELSVPGGSGGLPGAADGELIAVGQALGRVTAGPVTARWPSPRTACSAMDGIAVRAADLARAPAVPADGGDGDRTASDRNTGDRDNRAERTVRLPAGQFEWIDTGDPLPDGADTVVIRERLLPQADGGVLITPVLAGMPGGRRAPGRHVRAAGEDFQAGELLVPGGRRLRPGDLAAVAAGGHAAVPVVRRPAVAIIPTGDEIRPVGAVLRRGDIMDTNSLMLAARCRQLGAAPAVSDVVPDEPDALTAEIRQAAASADLVLVIAGSSRGRGDHAAAVLAQVGGVAVAGVAVRPGHPALLGHAKRPAGSDGDPVEHRAGIAPVIGLPGYPLATAVVFELFAVPVLAALTGQAAPTGPAAAERVRARLDRDWSSPADVEDWVLVTLTADGRGAPTATPVRRGASSISQLARADAWWVVPAGQGSLASGTEIGVTPIPGTGWPAG